jgi:hypothetical protein
VVGTCVAGRCQGSVLPVDRPIVVYIISIYLIGAGLVTVATSSMNVRTVVMPQLHGIPKVLQVDATWSCVFMQIDRLEAFAVR